MPPRTRKTAVRKSPATKPAVALGLVLDRPEAQEEIARLVADREPFFTIGETTYTVPKQTPAAWTIQAVRIAEETGETAALDWGFQVLLGDEGYAALTSFVGVSDSDWLTLSRAVTAKLIPADPKA